MSLVLSCVALNTRPETIRPYFAYFYARGALTAYLAITSLSLEEGEL